MIVVLLLFFALLVVVAVYVIRIYNGLVALRDELKARFPDLLITGEGWYDALGAVTPISHAGLPAACDRVPRLTHQPVSDPAPSLH